MYGRVGRRLDLSSLSVPVRPLNCTAKQIPKEIGCEREIWIIPDFWGFQAPLKAFCTKNTFREVYINRVPRWSNPLGVKWDPEEPDSFIFEGKLTVWLKKARRINGAHTVCCFETNSTSNHSVRGDEYICILTEVKWHMGSQTTPFHMAYTLVLPEGQVLTVRFVDSAPVVLCHWTTDGNYPQIHSTTSKFQDRSKVSFRSPEKRRSYEDKIPCVPPGGKCGTQQDWQGSTSVRSSRVFTLISLPFWSDSVKGREGKGWNETPPPLSFVPSQYFDIIASPFLHAG